MNRNRHPVLRGRVYNYKDAFLRNNLMGGMAKGRSAEALKEGPQPVCTLSEQHWEQDQAMEEE